ncbi:MAG: YdcF family protein [Alphaproteobacteria bacterium]|nr:YdcF family protein [Alphaproteobacteria bacterium]
MIPPGPRRQRGTRRFFFGFLASFLVLAGSWGAGLVWFAGHIPDAVADTTSRTDAIVVLTGGQGRLEAGLNLLTEDMAERLFVSGVYRGIDVKTLLRVFRRTNSDLEDRVHIGGATNTTGNASETEEWIRRQNIGSIRLVTAGYHMPRSLLEFRHAMSDITIIPHPVFSDNVKQKQWWAWRGTALLIAGEFTKYLLARARHAGRGLIPTTKSPR